MLITRYTPQVYAYAYISIYDDVPRKIFLQYFGEILKRSLQNLLNNKTMVHRYIIITVIMINGNKFTIVLLSTYSNATPLWIRQQTIVLRMFLIDFQTILIHKCHGINTSDARS